MTIEKLPSGSYRIKQQFEGKRYCITVPYKPTQKEAVQLMAEKTKGLQPKHSKQTFADACREYISMKENVLSPRTIREYGLYIARLPEWFTTMPVSAITQDDLQKCVNELALNKAPKTVRTLHGFISAVLSHFNPQMKIYTTLPQKRKNEPYIPSEEDIKTILEYTKEHAPHYYVAISLACYGLRRSEICALKYPDDLDVENCTIKINKALVEDKDGKWVVKTTKTTNSTREINIPSSLVEVIQERGCFYDGFPQSISNYLIRTQNKLGIPNFSIHKCRHFFASKLMDMGVDSKTIQSLGGWQGDETLKNIYQHSLAMKDAERRKQIADALGNNFL